jgi:two-component system, NarL family, invasion response regulator UvrY
MIRVLVADDQPAMRRGVRHVLTVEPDIEVVAESDLSAVAFELERHKVDLLLLEIGAGGRPDFQLLRQVRGLQPQLPILVYTCCPDDLFALPAFRSGATGYLCKWSPEPELIRAIRQVAQHQRYVAATMAGVLLNEFCAPVSRAHLPHEQLSKQEYRVLCMFGAGLGVKQVADKLLVSPKTVSTFRARIIRKLGCSTTAELIRYAIEHRLVCTGIGVCDRSGAAHNCDRFPVTVVSCNSVA